MNSPILHEPHERPEQVYVHMQDVDSQSIRRVGYNEDTQQLVVQFYDSLPGLRTVYSPVPRDVFDGLMAAASMGKYLEENIRYTYEFNLVNEDGLIDIEQAQLISIVEGKAVFKTADGYEMRGVGDDVYLGQITEVDPISGRVTARLNKGGIIDDIEMVLETGERFQQARGPQQLAPVEK